MAVGARRDSGSVTNSTVWPQLPAAGTVRGRGGLAGAHLPCEVEPWRIRRRACNRRKPCSARAVVHSNRQSYQQSGINADQRRRAGELGSEQVSRFFRGDWNSAARVGEVSSHNQIRQPTGFSRAARQKRGRTKGSICLQRHKAPAGAAAATASLAGARQSRRYRFPRRLCFLRDSAPAPLFHRPDRRSGCRRRN